MGLAVMFIKELEVRQKKNCTILVLVLLTAYLKGTVTQNIFSSKSGSKGCKDPGNDNDLQKYLEKKRRQINLMIFFGPPNYVSMILRSKVCIAP